MPKKEQGALFWSMIDDCGHNIVFDLSTPEKQTNIFKGLIRDVVRSMGLGEDGQDLAAKLLEKDVVTHEDEDLNEFLEDYAELSLHQRGTEISYAMTEWPNGFRSRLM